MSRAAHIFTHRHYRPHHLLTLGLLAVFTLWLLVWLAASIHINRTLDRWSAAFDMEAKGLSFSDKSTNGSPWMVYVHLDDFSYFQPNGDGIEATEAVLSFPLWDWRDLSFKLRGSIRAQINQQSFALSAAKFGFRRPDETPAGHQETGLSFRATLHGLILQNAGPFLLGEQIGALSVSARVLGGTPDPSDLDALVAWRDGSGVIEVDTLELSWGPLNLSLKGTLALDSALQPEGAFAGRIYGLEETIALCQSAACLQPREINLLLASVSVLARPNGASPIVPLSVQGGSLYVGPVKITKVPTLVW